MVLGDGVSYYETIRFMKETIKFMKRLKVAYAKKELKADIIVDMATLTGAQQIATGKYHAAIVTNNELWEDASKDAGKKSGDLCFPLVFTPEFHLREFDSDIADMRNSVIVSSYLS